MKLGRLFPPGDVHGSAAQLPKPGKRREHQPLPPFPTVRARYSVSVKAAEQGLDATLAYLKRGNRTGAPNGDETLVQAVYAQLPRRGDVPREWLMGALADAVSAMDPSPSCHVLSVANDLHGQLYGGLAERGRVLELTFRDGSAVADSNHSRSIRETMDLAPPLAGGRAYARR